MMSDEEMTEIARDEAGSSNCGVWRPMRMNFMRKNDSSIVILMLVVGDIIIYTQQHQEQDHF